jgi:hypothetical protein
MPTNVTLKNPVGAVPVDEFAADLLTPGGTAGEGIGLLSKAGYLVMR